MSFHRLVEGACQLAKRRAVGGSNVKMCAPLLLLAASGTATAEWVEYSTQTNGDVLYFDEGRVERDGSLVSVWSRVRFKSSMMGASSFQRLVSIDCSELTEATVQRTFYSDANWETPAMATDTKMKKRVAVKPGSATHALADIVCE